MFKVLVCGGREYGDAAFLYDFLDDLALKQRDKAQRITHVIHGDARGADHLAQGWAVTRGFQPVRVPALWSMGPKAGAIRNKNMLELGPDLVVAFPGGPGTAHMVRIAQEKGVAVLFAAPVKNNP